MSLPPSRANSKTELQYKASSIYESWMDGSSIKSAEIRETPTPIAQRKQRSNYKFDKRYADAVSVTPVMHSPIPSLEENRIPSIPKIPRTPPPQKSKKIPKKQPTQSIATSPLLIEEEDYSEFFDWIFNGNEDDINPAEIERMLFKTPKKVLKNK